MRWAEADFTQPALNLACSKLTPTDSAPRDCLLYFCPHEEACVCPSTYKVTWELTGKARVVGEVLGSQSGDPGQLALRKKEVTSGEQLPNYHTANKASALGSGRILAPSPWSF